MPDTLTIVVGSVAGILGAIGGMFLRWAQGTVLVRKQVTTERELYMQEVSDLIDSLKERIASLEQKVDSLQAELAKERAENVALHQQLLELMSKQED